MYNPATDKAKLCDFDFCHFRKEDDMVPVEPTGLSSIGTWIFMANELLTVGAMKGNVKRVYTHEVEAFVAVLVYIVCRYEGGKLKVNPPLDQWNRTLASFDRRGGERDSTYNSIIGVTNPVMDKPYGIPEEFWNALILTLFELIAFRAERMSANYRQRAYERSGLAVMRPQIDPDALNTLHALPRIVDWALFRDLSSAEGFVQLLKERHAGILSQEATM